MRFHFHPRREVSYQVHLYISYYKKIIFIFPIAITSSPPSHKVPSPSPLGLGWFAAAAPNRQTSVPPPGLVIPLAAQSQFPLPAFTNFTRCQIHSCPYLIPPDSIHHQGIYPPDSRLWRSPTIVITVKTINYNRNTYIYYYIYLEKHHISEYTHIIAIYTNLPFSHFFPIFSLYQKTQNWRFLSDSKNHTFF